MVKWMLSVSLVSVLAMAQAHAESFEQDRKNILNLSGCFNVDYSYAETKVIKEGYELDSRIYDATNGKTVKEYIAVLSDEGTRIRLQHILMVQNATGTLVKMKHHGENWTYEKPVHYEFVGAGQYQPRVMEDVEGTWTREITNLDDGPRYQCAAKWDYSQLEPAWECENFSPIPGREFRDMQRRDYNSMQRVTKVLSYPWGWLERQRNQKVIFENGERTPLVEELGKDFYIRLPDSHCQEAKAWAQPRQAFWSLSQSAWNEILDGQRSITVKPQVGGQPLYAKLWALEADLFEKVQHSEFEQSEALRQIKMLIEEYL